MLIKENNIFTLEEKLRSAQSSLPIPLQIGFMEIPVRKRLPSRAGTARLRRLGDIGVNSQRAVTALPTRPLSGRVFKFKKYPTIGTEIPQFYVIERIFPILHTPICHTFFHIMVNIFYIVSNLIFPNEFRKGLAKKASIVNSNFL